MRSEALLYLVFALQAVMGGTASANAPAGSPHVAVRPVAHGALTLATMVTALIHLSPAPVR